MFKLYSGLKALFQKSNNNSKEFLKIFELIYYHIGMSLKVKKYRKQLSTHFINTIKWFSKAMKLGINEWINQKKESCWCFKNVEMNSYNIILNFLEFIDYIMLYCTSSRQEELITG